MTMNAGLKVEDMFFGDMIGRESKPLTELGNVDMILNPKVKTKEDFPSLRVLKYGRTTHWTAGISNEIMSDVNRSFGVAKQWLIIGQQYFFSAPGDSGAVVVDYRNRILGIVSDFGALTGPGHSMSYATPIEWVLESIGSTFGGTLTLS